MKFITIEKLEKLMQDLMEKINSKFVTEDKFTNQMAGKSDKNHTHDDIYYTEAEINSKLDEKADKEHTHEDLEGGISNLDTDVKIIYGEIRTLNTYMSKKLDAQHFNQIYKTIDNDITELETAMDGKSSLGHTHDDIYYTESEIDTKVSNLQKGIDAVAEELTDVDTTLNGYIGEAFGVLSEHQGKLNNHEARITHNEHVIGTIQGEGAGSIKYIVDEAVGKEEERAKSAELVLQTAIDGKADKSHGTHVEFTAITPSANGTASVGTSSKVARADHIHPLQTTVNGVSFWTGTQAQYDAIASKSSTTLYFIID